MADNEDNNQNNVDVSLSRCGLSIKSADRPDIIAALEVQIRLEAEEAGDQFLMRLLCVQLFSLGIVGDSLLVWRAKQRNFDTHRAIDVQFLAGAGLEQTKSFLPGVGSDDARDALIYLADCESKGNLSGFSVGRVLEQAKADHGVA